MNNRKPTRATRPDRTMFFVMIGVFFVFFSLPAFYWALYNYGEYSRTNTFLGKQQKSSDADLSPTERQERSERISIYSSRASRYMLEMALSGVGGFIFSGIALLFLTKAICGEKKKKHLRKN